MSMKIVVCGAGGFIGGHLMRSLLNCHSRDVVVGVDIKPKSGWHQVHEEAVNRCCEDLRDFDTCRHLLADADVVYNLAADMGGIGYIETHKVQCMLSVLINTNLLMAAKETGVYRYFFSSSACVYPAGKQDTIHPAPLKESDAYPAMPEDGYGWEKLFSERMCRHFREDFELETRVARYHNIYGPFGTYAGGREKAPAAICRKIATAKLERSKSIEIWGDGYQTRSFAYIDDCVYGTRAIAESDIPEPVNLGSSELVSINDLVSLVEDIAGYKVQNRIYQIDAPKGVKGRNSDNTLIREYLGWEPSIPLRDGLEKTYRWIYDDIQKKETL